MKIEILHVPDCPNVALLEQRLHQAHAGDRYGARVEIGECCSPADALRSARARTAPADPTERALHHAILESFATTGRAPSHDELGRITSQAPQVIRSPAAASP